MNLLKKLRSKIYRTSPLLRKWWFFLQFIKNNKYIPNFKNPKTYNEKTNFRKNDPKNPLFSICADKIKAKEYVAEQISPDIIIPNYYVGESITFEQMKAILAEHGDCLLKANHNSGPVHLLNTESTDAEIKAAVDSTLDQLTDDFGKRLNEPWYSDIKRGVLVEKRLDPEPGESDIRDYKFHVFKQKDGTFKVVLGVYFDRGINVSATFFDENMKWISLTYNYANIYTETLKPKSYERMIEISKKLAEPFSYARIDLYNVNGDIYFGEITFADGSGSAPFGTYAHDLWMGNLWQGDPRY